jgi:hypothetical protein
MTEGARWWNQAFEAAGFRDGFQVRTLPADVDPMDIRYNVVHGCIAIHAAGPMEIPLWIPAPERS